MSRVNRIPAAPMLALLSAALTFACTHRGHAAPLTVSIASPAIGQTFAAPGSVVLGAVVNGPVRWVDFYWEGALVGWAEQEPFTFDWSGLPSGEYVIEARATDFSGQTAVSDPVRFQVIEEPVGSLARGPYIMMGHYTNRSTIVSGGPTPWWPAAPREAFAGGRRLAGVRRRT